MHQSFEQDKPITDLTSKSIAAGLAPPLAGSLSNDSDISISVVFNLDFVDISKVRPHSIIASVS
jgi:hypothetical protein